MTYRARPEHLDYYYFYLVSFDGEPEDLLPILASELYEDAEIEPCSYAVRFDFGHASKSRN
jgi:hypothetical protein